MERPTENVTVSITGLLEKYATEHTQNNGTEQLENVSVALVNVTEDDSWWNELQDNIDYWSEGVVLLVICVLGILGKLCFIGMIRISKQWRKNKILR